MGGGREQVIQLMEVTQAATGWFGSDLEQLRWRRCSCSLDVLLLLLLLLPSLILSLQLSVLSFQQIVPRSVFLKFFIYTQ